MKKILTTAVAALALLATATPASAQSSTNVYYSETSEDTYPYLTVHHGDGTNERIPQTWTAYHATSWYLSPGRCAVVSLYRDGEYTGETFRVGSPGWRPTYTYMTNRVRVFTC